MHLKLVDYLSKNLDDKIINYSTIHGGCINECFKLQSKTRDYFVKINSSFNFFKEEVKGLDLLRKTGSFHIPKIINYGISEGTAFLIMDFIKSNKPVNNFWHLFAKKLAKLHNVTNDNFGLEYNNYIGSLKQENTITNNAVDFFINCRLVPQLKQLNKNISSSFYKKFDKLLYQLNNIIPKEPPSLVHGDLWSGNYLVNNLGQPSLVDPAIYYGSREAEIAMTKLFGGFPNHFYELYNEEFQLQAGWENRIEIWNLYPLLVHANLFGESYLNQINFILKKYN